MTTLSIKTFRLDDPDGHNPALLLKGDWLIVEISDGQYSGYGEASHSRDDDACEQCIVSLFNQHVKNLDVSMQQIQALSSGVFSTADSFIEATAISGINQALCDLLAKREQRSAWTLYSETKQQTQVPVYTTINRALSSRSLDDYQRIVSVAVQQGFRAIKCAPFERVSREGDQVAQSQAGLSVLKHLRQTFPDLSIRIDFHERFNLSAFMEILPAIEAIEPYWIEAPIALGPAYLELRKSCQHRMALGELYFGHAGFADICNNNWADVIMPDVKHVGGFTPLCDVVQYFSKNETIEISPHNPSGPIASLASLHAAAVTPKVTSLEIPLIVDEERAYYLSWLEDGCFQIPDAVGWGDEFTLLEKMKNDS